jgi:hypothetical protein
MDLRELGQTPELGQPTSVTTCISRIERCSKWSASEEDMRIANAAVNTLTESLPSLNPEDQLRVWKALDSVKHGNLFLRIWAHVKGIQSYHDLQQNVATLSARVETELAPHSARFGQIYHRLQRQSSDPMMKNLVTKFYRHVSDEIPKANRATTKVAIQRHDVNSVHLQLLSANVRYLEYSLAHAMITLQQLEEKRHPPLLPTLGAQKRQERGAQLDDAIEETWQIIEALVVAGTPVNRTLNLDSHPEPFALLQGAIVAGRESLVRELVTRGACWESGERPEDSTRTLPQQSREDWEQFLQRAKHSNMNQVARTLIMCLVRI